MSNPYDDEFACLDCESDDCEHVRSARALHESQEEDRAMERYYDRKYGHAD